MSPDNPNPFLKRQRIVEMRRAAEKVWDKRNLKKIKYNFTYNLFWSTF